jgi:hypothetical protein
MVPEELQRLFADPRAEKGRRPRRRLMIDGPLGEHAWLTGDALVDLVAARTPRVWTLAADDPRRVAAELRRRLRGTVSSRFVQEAVHLRNEDGRELRILDAELRGPLAEPVVTLRGARLFVEGPDAGTLADADDLRGGVLRLTDPDVLRRRPEAVVTIARLAARPELRLDDETRERTRAALADGALAAARMSRLHFALDDLFASPDAIEALEMLRDLSAPHPLHESAEVDGDLLRRADALLPAGADRRRMLRLAVARTATRHRVRSFAGRSVDFAGPEARAVVAAAGPARRPLWALPRAAWEDTFG